MMPRRSLFSEVHREPLFMTWLRRTVVCFVGIHVVLSMWSGYRAIVQVYEFGPAVVRATAFGSSQFLRTPPPEVRELTVEIRPD